MKAASLSAASGLPKISFLVGHEFPHHNRCKKDYPDQIRPATSFLELFLIYHGGASQD